AGREKKALKKLRFCGNNACVLGVFRASRVFPKRKGPGHAGASPFALKPTAYLSAVCTLVKVVFSFEPRPCTTAMIATEMPAAMRPYSMAVAPDSSFTNFNTFFIFGSIAPTVAERGSGGPLLPG